MPGDKYLIASNDNMLQINIRNILNPAGFVHILTCAEIGLLMRSARSMNPDSIILDSNFNYMELINVIAEIEDSVDLAIVIISDPNDSKFVRLLEKSKYLMICPKPISRDVLLFCVQMSMVNYKRISELNKKLNEINLNFESRKIIERAKGIIMEREKMTEDQAYALIRKRSMDLRMTIRGYSTSILNGEGV